MIDFSSSLLKVTLIALALTGCIGQSVTSDVTHDSKELINSMFDEANQKNQSAKAQFEKNVSTAITSNQSALLNARKQAAEDVSTYKRCVKIVWYLVKDKVKKTHSTESYLLEIITPIVTPDNTAFSKELEIAISDFDNAIQQNASGLAKGLATLDTEHQPLVGGLPNMIDANKEIKTLATDNGKRALEAVRKLPELSSTTRVKISQISKKIFSRQVSKVVGSLTAASLDGPLPIGDFIGSLIFLKTAYDVKQLRPKFEADIYDVLVRSLDEDVRDLKKKLDNHQIEMIAKFDQFHSEQRMRLDGKYQP